MEQNQIVEVREGAGIGGLTCPPIAALTTLAEELIGVGQPIEVVLCGMASSRNGVMELPYAKAPASFTAWARQAQRLQAGSLDILLATGIQCGNEAQGFEVMRGEETQIFGAAHIDTALNAGNESHCYVLPGTHSKWAELQDGSVLRFRTALTGEVYALLRQHSTLLRTSTETSNATEFDRGFADGSKRSERIDDGLLTAIFQTRTAQLLQGQSHAWACGFLSGLLIGYELATMSAAFGKPSNITLIGQTQLALLYQRIFTARGISTRILDGAVCVIAGLRRLRELHTPQ
jgi:2-dehydro-3-deoxygalactonokinase